MPPFVLKLIFPIGLSMEEKFFRGSRRGLSEPLPGRAEGASSAAAEKIFSGIARGALFFWSFSLCAQR